MKAQLIQCSERPRVEPHGNTAIVTFSDLSGSTVEVELSMAHIVSLGNDLLELHHDFVAVKQGKNHLHPVFVDVLKWCTP